MGKNIAHQPHIWYKALLSGACSSQPEIEVPEYSDLLTITRYQIRTHAATVRLGALKNQGFRTGYVED